MTKRNKTEGPTLINHHGHQGYYHLFKGQVSQRLFKNLKNIYWILSQTFFSRIHRFPELPKYENCCPPYLLAPHPHHLSFTFIPLSSFSSCSSPLNSITLGKKAHTLVIKWKFPFFHSHSAHIMCNIISICFYLSVYYFFIFNIIQVLANTLFASSRENDSPSRTFVLITGYWAFFKESIDNSSWSNVGGHSEGVIKGQQSNLDSNQTFLLLLVLLLMVH